MPSTSKKQHNFMAAIAHSPAFAKKVGVPQSVGQDFSTADKGRKFAKGGDMATKGMGLFKGKETYGEELKEAKAIKSGKLTPQQYAKGEKSEDMMKKPRKFAIGGAMGAPAGGMGSPMGAAPKQPMGGMGGMGGMGQGGMGQGGMGQGGMGGSNRMNDLWSHKKSGVSQGGMGGTTTTQGPGGGGFGQQGTGQGTTAAYQQIQSMQQQMGQNPSPAQLAQFEQLKQQINSDPAVMKAQAAGKAAQEQYATEGQKYQQPQQGFMPQPQMGPNPSPSQSTGIAGDVNNIGHYNYAQNANTQQQKNAVGNTGMQQAAGYKKGGSIDGVAKRGKTQGTMVKKYAKGGSIDGCAQRGKTRGTMR
jgi:hypothetical protein